MERVVIARRRSRPGERGDVVAFCIQVTEMERRYPDGPVVFRDCPDIYGPSEQSLEDWFNHVVDGRECRFWGQWTYNVYLLPIRDVVQPPSP